MHLGVGDQSPRLDHTGDVDSVAFSHDDKQVVSDHTVRVWGEGVIGPLEGDTDEVNSVAFSHDGKRIVSSSDDSTIRMDSEQQIGSLGYHVRILECTVCHASRGIRSPNLTCKIKMRELYRTLSIMVSPLLYHHYHPL